MDYTGAQEIHGMQRWHDRGLRRPTRSLVYRYLTGEAPEASVGPPAVDMV